MPLSINFDVSCLGNQQLTGIGNYAKNLITQLAKIPEISMTGSYKVSRWKKAATITQNVPFRVFAYWPWISDSINQDFKIYHGLDFFVPASTQFKKIVTVHDLAVYKPGFWNEKEAKTSIAGFEKILFKHRPDHVITVSESVKNEFLEKFSSFEGRVSAIYHGADHFIVPNPGAPIYDFPYVFYLGTVEARKNIIGLVKAFELLASKNSDIRLIIGGQAGFRSDEVREKIDSSPFKNRIIWNEKVSDREVKNIMQHCTVFCYPSLYEGFGIPLVEAMASGAPIITSNFGAMKEIAGNAALLFDPYGPVDDLADKLDQVASSPSLQSDLRNRGYSRIHEFTWEKAAKKTLDIYKSM
ncbi:MAG: glycosyltransferase family 4 protein [Cytophagales bacterium]|nr:glycosyltransferase family 4 protein [Cytophagales bacterium]